MDIPEIIPLQITPDEDKGVAPTAVKRSHPAFHNPGRKKDEKGDPRKRKRKKNAPDREPCADPPSEGESGRGVKIDLLA